MNMKQKMIDQLNVLRNLHLKPNFSEIARTCNMDRRTVKRYWDMPSEQKRTRIRKSKLDQIHEHIAAVFLQGNVTAKDAYQILAKEHSDLGSYSNFTKYIKKHKLTAKSGKGA